MDNEQLVFVLKKISIETFFKQDITKFASHENRWYLLQFVARILKYANPDIAQILMREAEIYLGEKKLFVRPQDVEYKQYPPDEKITSVSQVIRGSARIINALAESKCEYAYDVAKRFTWEPTKQILLCGILACALKLGNLTISQEIYSSFKDQKT